MNASILSQMFANLRSSCFTDRENDFLCRMKVPIAVLQRLLLISSVFNDNVLDSCRNSNAKIQL